jgi:hypothetical protein
MLEYKQTYQALYRAAGGSIDFKPPEGEGWELHTWSQDRELSKQGNALLVWRRTAQATPVAG